MGKRMEETMKLYDSGVYLVNGNELVPDGANAIEEVVKKTGAAVTKEQAAENTIAYGILKNHNTSGNMDKLQIKFDKLTSHDITFVGIIQTARASGLEKFPIPYVLTNCHNSLCAVGGTINEDDHMFGLTCAKKYGGVYVPPHQAVIHQFAREMLAAGGAMILGSDSHTRAIMWIPGMREVTMWIMVTVSRHGRRRAMVRMMRSQTGTCNNL